MTSEQFFIGWAGVFAYFLIALLIQIIAVDKKQFTIGDRLSFSLFWPMIILVVGLANLGSVIAKLIRAEE